MQCDETLTALGLQESAEVLRPGWEGSARSLPEGEIAFLTESFLRQAVMPFAADPDGVSAAVAMAQRVAGDPALRALAWHYHCVLYGPEPLDWGRISKWPALTQALGKDAGLFDTLAFLSGVPKMHEVHRARHVPDQVIRATLADVSIGLRSHHRSFGMAADDVGWFSHFARGELYRLGRLQFQLDCFAPHVRACRHRDTRAVLALAEAGRRFRADGQLAPTKDEPDHWQATLEITDTSITGCPILPQGIAIRTPVGLSLSDWELAASPTDRALAVHIPGGEPGDQRMDLDACGDSFRRALEFFPRHYPDFDFVGFCCESWLLNSWLEQVLPPTSNIVRFQREVYLFPEELDPQEVVRTAFDGQVPTDLSQASRKTSLQRAILAVVGKGEEVPVAAGGCFLLSEDIARWGTKFYRTQALPVVV